MLDVVQVVAHLLRLFLEIVGVPVTDLGPPRDPGRHHGADPVIGNGPGEEVEVRQRVRPGPDKVDVAPQDVHELRQLVEAEPAEPPAGAGDPVVIVPGPLRRVAVRRVHGPELQ